MVMGNLHTQTVVTMKEDGNQGKNTARVKMAWLMVNTMKVDSVITNSVDSVSSHMNSEPSMRETGDMENNTVMENTRNQEVLFTKVNGDKV